MSSSPSSQLTRRSPPHMPDVPSSPEPTAVEEVTSHPATTSFPLTLVASYEDSMENEEPVPHLIDLECVTAWLPRLGIRTYIFPTGLPVLLSFSSDDLISSPLPIVVARYFFTLPVPSTSFPSLPFPSGTFRSRSLYVPLPSGSFCTLPTCSG